MPSPLKPLAGARHVRILGTIALVLAVALAVADGCASYSTDATTALLGPFNNSTDPTNGGASYIGSAAFSACHSDVAELTRVHGHSQALKASNGLPPEYPPEGTRAGVPKLVWQMGFGVWWALPAIVAGVILLIENAGRTQRRDWSGPSW